MFRKVWDYVNNYYGYMIPFKEIKDVDIVILDTKKWHEYFSKSVNAKVNMKYNEMEKKQIEALNSRHPWVKTLVRLETDAALSYLVNKDDYSIKKILIMVKKDVASTIRGRQALKLGFTIEEYYLFHILHEFIHILERKTKRQLLKREYEDTRLWCSFVHNHVRRLDTKEP